MTPSLSNRQVQGDEFEAVAVALGSGYSRSPDPAAGLRPLNWAAIHRATAVAGATACARRPK